MIAILWAVMVVYFVLWNTSQAVIAGLAARYLWGYRWRRSPRNRALVSRLAAPPFVSIVVPARNENSTIVEAIRALLSLDYSAREIIVVNDGSTDGTLSTLKEVFHLVTGPMAFDRALSTAPVHALYRSIDEPDLVVVDKDSAGCKADASNAGINAASGTLVLVIDADTILEPDALSRAVLRFLEDPLTVAVGGYVAIANGCRVEQGQVTDVTMPRNWLARFQVVEYMRSFLLFRITCALANGLTIISGAFGLYRRDVLIAIGGYDKTSIAEDMDLTLRLQRYCRTMPRPGRIRFVPLPVCWTQAPEDWRSLSGQRCRWRRGLLQVFREHRSMVGNPRFGSVGLWTLPYTLVFDGFGPLLETVGCVIVTTAALLGVLSWRAYGTMLIVSLLFGGAMTLMAVFVNDAVTRRYHRTSDLLLIIATALLENVGYRQLNSWWGCVGTVQAVTGKGGWGSQVRRPFSA
jgi:cellulose synthase/poly-beta-1,6-N-acetylglucosamine synthase-like glycosyltransferase